MVRSWLVVVVIGVVALGVPVHAQDDAALAEVRARAEAGDAEAQAILGYLYDNGSGVAQDEAEAVRWYRTAAEQGDASAQLNLGVMYYRGAGVPQDYVQAHTWANLAASRLTGEDREIAVKNRDAVADLMTPEQIAEAQRLARERDAAHTREP